MAASADSRRTGFRAGRKSPRRSGCTRLWPTVLSLALALSALPVVAATGCYTELCSASCTPDAPVQISTLVPDTEFPGGANTPVGFVDPDDGSQRRFIPTREGAILLWDGATHTIRPTFFLDLRSAVGGPVDASASERGLLAMAVDPDYAANGRFYLFYTRVDEGPDTRGDVVIEQYERSAGDPEVADAASARRILVIDHPASNHNGGFMAFGPGDGFLYISTGDGGGSCDGGLGLSGDGQSSNTLNGKILRIDVRGIDPQGGAPDDCVANGSSPDYTVPSSNPYFGQEPACDEVWALGLRNPFRFSFDRETGDLYIGDVGQRKWEEINLQAASTASPVNFGWSCREGCETAANDESACSTTGCPVDTGTSCEFPRATGFWDPALCHYNGGWRSIMGGYRYRGSRVPSLAGDYFYGDAYCGQIWRTTALDPADPAAMEAECWASGFSGNYGFAEDGLGELYIVVGGAGRIDCIHNGEGCWWAAGERNTLFTPVEPCRVIDTRLVGGRFGGGGTRDFRVLGGGLDSQGGAGDCGVPADAVSVQLNFTVVNPAGFGYLRAWPQDIAEPTATLLAFTAGPGVSNSVSLAVCNDCASDLTVRIYGADTHLVAEVLGYYRAVGAP